MNILSRLFASLRRKKPEPARPAVIEPSQPWPRATRQGQVPPVRNPSQPTRRTHAAPTVVVKQAKWCSYCRKDTHNDSECHSTRPAYQSDGYEPMSLHGLSSWRHEPAPSPEPERFTSGGDGDFGGGGASYSWGDSSSSDSSSSCSSDSSSSDSSSSCSSD